MRWSVWLLLVLPAPLLAAQDLRVISPGQNATDRRLGELRNLNAYFPFHAVEGVKQWEQRQKQIRRRILVSQGLWPMPTKTPLNAVIHGRVEREDYVVDRVFFESIPGHYVTGSLYRPKGDDLDGEGGKRRPAILSAHGHWSNGRFYDAGPAGAKAQIEIGAETSPVAAQFPLQARAVHLARMGCIVFFYDMTGYADSVQIGHRPDDWKPLDRPNDWGFMSAAAELRLQNMMGLQTWNSIRAVDFVKSLPEVDPDRIGITGGSGGGTQSMILGAIDTRVAAAMPCVMVSTSMQGGCTCENAPLMRIDQGNIDIAAAVAPRPLGLTAADDWTVELETKGYPDLKRLYKMLGVEDRLTAVFHTQFKHNYNLINRLAMYQFFKQHFGLKGDAAKELDFRPLSHDEATVWTSEHPKPSGEQVGAKHETTLLRMATQDSQRQMTQLIESDSDRFNHVVGGGWEVILGRRADEVGRVIFEATSRSENDDVIQVKGWVRHVDAKEQIPVVRWMPGKTKPRGVLVWIGDHGKSEWSPQGQLANPVRRALDAGYEVLAADLLGQGELRDSDETTGGQRMWFQPGSERGWRRFSGYTYGYNHPQFVKRVHDVMTLAKFAGTLSGSVRLVGAGRVAGPLALAARSQLGMQKIDGTLVDLAGFRFASVRRQDDEMFVPGAVKYLDVNGLIALGGASPLTIVQEAEDFDAETGRAGGSDVITTVADRDQLIRTLVRPN